MLIALEGIDSAGKETHSKRLVERLNALGVPTERLAFPVYDTNTGRLIRALLQQLRSLGQSAHESRGIYPAPASEQALLLQSMMTVNRYEHYARLHLARGGSGPSLVLDRYWLSGLAYGMADGLDCDWLRSVHRALPVADLTLFLDIPVEESFRRRPVREDAYEANRERLERVRQGYQALGDTVARVDGMGTTDEVAARIWALTLDLLERRI